MNYKSYHDFCLQQVGSVASFPFDNDTIVFKVGNKMFSLGGVSKFEFINVKCDPITSQSLQEKYYGDIYPGYHMNKKHWISIKTNSIFVPDKVIFDCIKKSYSLVFHSLTKKLQSQILNS